MVRHNNILPNVHLKKDWQEKVKTWLNQPGRKKRRRVTRQKKAVLIAPNPTNFLRPAVRGQTNRYNGKIKLGRGFTLRELREAGVKGVEYARSIGIAVDLRRKDTSIESLKLNAGRVKEYISRLILYPRGGKYQKNAPIAEAKPEVLAGPDAKIQNTTRSVIPLPKAEPGFAWTAITKEMKEANAFKTLRTELKTSKGFYKRLDDYKKKKASGKK